MIGFNELGRKGNLGNQMFQFAALRGIAAHNNYSWRVPPNDQTRIHEYSLFRLFNLYSLKKQNIGYVPFQTYKMPEVDGEDSVKFEFDEVFFNNLPDNVNINGFFQSEKYFLNIRDEIKSDFSFKNKHLRFVDPYSKALDDKFIALHVRRGDYLKHPHHHPVLSNDYYSAALDLLPKWPIVVFTDDKAFVEQLSFLRNRTYFVSNFVDFGNDLCLMTMASAVIAANSSFSWWGAWLSQTDLVCAPKLWFGSELAHLSTKDLIPEHWTRIE
jgi:hypothetical protein